MLALLFLALLCTLSIVLFAQTNKELRKSENLRDAADARLAAESGMQLMLYHLQQIDLPGDTTDTTLLANVYEVLAQRLNGTGNLAGATIQNNSEALFVPDIAMDDGGSFCAWIDSVAESRCRVKVVGSAHGLSRCLAMELRLAPKLSGVFEYGLASQGQIQIGGSTSIVGVNDPSEASVFSATTSYPDAIHVTGDAVEISGDLFLVGSSDYAVLTGSPSIGGTSDPDLIQEHVHCGIRPPGFPEPDVAPLAALATNVVDASTDTSGSGQVFDNIRIAAGTDPVFGGDAVVNGVVYVEAPNIVKFAGNAILNAIIVTEDSDQPLSACQITFAGTVEANGVEALPETPEFSAVREQTGTFIVAPGFGVNFQGAANVIQGSIAADQIAFSGNSGGTIKGTLIGLADLPMSLEGHVSILVDKSGLDDDPAGFVKRMGLYPAPDSYQELAASPD
jgi:hypothetical protein